MPPGRPDKERYRGTAECKTSMTFSPLFANTTLRGLQIRQFETVPLPRMVPAVNDHVPGDMGYEVKEREVHLGAGVGMPDWRSVEQGWKATINPAATPRAHRPF